VLTLGAAGHLFIFTIYRYDVDFLPSRLMASADSGGPTLVARIGLWAFALSYTYRILFAGNSHSSVHGGYDTPQRAIVITVTLHLTSSLGPR
jgi:hypothetical protein